MLCWWSHLQSAQSPGWRQPSYRLGWSMPQTRLPLRWNESQHSCLSPFMQGVCGGRERGWWRMRGIEIVRLDYCCRITAWKCTCVATRSDDLCKNIVYCYAAVSGNRIDSGSYGEWWRVVVWWGWQWGVGNGEYLVIWREFYQSVVVYDNQEDKWI